MGHLNWFGGSIMNRTSHLIFMLILFFFNDIYFLFIFHLYISFAFYKNIIFFLHNFVIFYNFYSLRAIFEGQDFIEVQKYYRTAL